MRKSIRDSGAPISFAKLFLSDDAAVLAKSRVENRIATPSRKNHVDGVQIMIQQWAEMRRDV